MTDLPSRLKRLCAFDLDKSMTAAVAQWTNNCAPPEYDESFSDGAEWQAARLKLLLEKLIECVNALGRADIEFKNCEYKRSRYEMGNKNFELLSNYMQAILPMKMVADQALTALEAEVQKMEGKCLDGR